MKKILFTILFAVSCQAFAAESVDETRQRIPLFATLFHDIGWNTLGVLTYGYGLPWVAAAGGTYGFIESGIDWKWNRFCVRHETASTIATLPGGVIGSFAPFVVPLAMYYGSDNHDIQFDGLAMGQAALLGWGYTSVIKAFTGRIPPHVREAADGDEDFQDDYSDGFRFGFWRGGIFNGWPSGHTATATAMAVTLATLHPDNNYILAGAIGYSVMVGVSMSFMAHWASDIFAGAITGFLIGRTVGNNFKKLRDGESPDKVSFYVSPRSANLVVTF